ncbi:uncharacterized protein LOC132341449 isoform X2 [Haemorhous mexicanus]|uniref:uncharacterized protein LOC132341449 isoform X2 n=1 Tax=Haemorhous mexicanus TaxID=30427 RepID=UPI0028BE86C5|nr:uncharacterized protein LOC132341449 isoform X2 [Haemorhous mexicanus]
MGCGAGAPRSQRKRRCAGTGGLSRNAGRDGVSHRRLLCRGDRGQLGVCCMRLNGRIGGQGSRGNVQKGRWGRQRGGGGRGLDHHRRWTRGGRRARGGDRCGHPPCSKQRNQRPASWDQLRGSHIPAGNTIKELNSNCVPKVSGKDG